MTDLESKLKILEALARGSAEGSPEQAALRSAAEALIYVHQCGVEEKFGEWLRNGAAPLTPLQILNAKLMGIDVPHELLDETTREIEVLLEKLRQRTA